MVNHLALGFRPYIIITSLMLYSGKWKIYSIMQNHISAAGAGKQQSRGNITKKIGSYIIKKRKVLSETKESQASYQACA